MLLQQNQDARPVVTAMRAVVVGAVGSTEVLVEELARASGWKLPLVVTLPPELHGRHSDMVDLAAAAKSAGADFLTVSRTNDAATIAAVRAAEPDYVFVVGWSQLVGPEFLQIATRGSIGYHPAALPRLRGRAAIPWTILLNEAITASSLFWIGAGTDDGDILAQHFFHVAPDETAASLYAQHMAALRTMLRSILPRLVAGDAPRIMQDERYATWATKRTAADGLIDWTRDAASIDRLIRAVGRPYPGAFTFIGSRRMKVWSARPQGGEMRHHAMAGQIISITGGIFLIQTGSGLLEITEWEIEGDRSPSVHAVLGRS